MVTIDKEPGSLAGASASIQAAARSAEQDDLPTFGTPPGKSPTMAWQENTDESGGSTQPAVSPGSDGIVAAIKNLTAGRPAAAVKIPGLRASCHCGGVPHSEVLRWWSEVSNEIQLITEAVDAKLDLWRARMTEKDQVIKRLYVKVKQLSESAKSPMPAVTQTGTRSPLRAATRSGRIAPASPSNHPRALLAAQSVDGLQSVGVSCLVKHVHLVLGASQHALLGLNCLI
ncbi:unnamed protein product [Durusdinium trenchii]|uniref:Uncharacterized protein n=1 Tax=Durusdinium trenchii TaxID=1381693 RepID=A0ABP0QVQ9_9DINO